MKIDILVSRRYSAVSNSKRQVEKKYNSISSQIERSELGYLLNKAEATHPSKLY